MLFAALALVALLVAPIRHTEARPARRDAFGDDDTSFALERLDPNFACFFTTDSILGARHFWCPAPCRLSDRVQRQAGEPLAPRHWQCPPTIASPSTPKEETCSWRRSGRLACPSHCGWQQDAMGLYTWACHDRSLRVQTAGRVQPELGWKTGSIDDIELRIRSSYLCPSTSLACPLRSDVDIGATLVPGGAHECLEVDEDVSSCGGCATIAGSGVDCTALPHANAGCRAGACQILSCKSGYSLSPDGSACLQSQR